MAGRFRFSFPQRRHQDDPWFRIGTLDVTTTVLVALLCCITIFVYAIDSSVLVHFVLLPDKVRRGQIWRLVTWPLVSLPDPQVIWTILRIAIFWWFARDLEAQIGRARFSILLGAVVIASGLLATGLGVGLVGLRYAELAVFVLFIAEHPRVPFFFGIPGWVIGSVFVGAEFLDLLGNRVYRLALILLVSLVLALLIGRAYGLAADQAWIPNLAHIGTRPRSRGATPRRSAGKSKKKRSGSAAVVSGPWAPPSQVGSSDQAEVDRMLDKISASGIDSLSADDKRRLKEASDRIRRERG